MSKAASLAKGGRDRFDWSMPPMQYWFGVVSWVSYQKWRTSRWTQSATADESALALCVENLRVVGSE